MAAKCCFTLGAIERLSQLLYIGGDEDRLQLFQGNLVCLAPVEKSACGPGIRLTGVPVPDVGGEELGEPAGCLLTGGDDGGGEPGEEVSQLTMWPKDDVVMVQGRGGDRSNTLLS